MAKSGGQPGNQNAAKGTRWREAILRALARASGTVDAGLDKAADKLVDLAAEGDRWALNHIAERLDGKATEIVEQAGKIVVEIKSFGDTHGEADNG